MEDLRITEYRNSQQDRMIKLREFLHVPLDHAFLEICKKFIHAQRQQLQILEEKWRMHANERGKLHYRLESKEKVPLQELKRLYTDFTGLLDEFIQQMAKMCNMVQRQHFKTIDTLRKEGLDILRETMRICLVLDKQPLCTNYEKKANEAPNLIFLGAQCLTEFDIVECNLIAVSQSDLLSRTKGNLPLDEVKAFHGFELNPGKKGKASGSKKAPESDCITKMMGTWFISKEKLNAMEKGWAHKDFLRLRYNVQIKVYGNLEDLVLLSLPFNIRKSSCQLYTFSGSLMWYFYTTKNPYEDFEVVSSLPTSTVVNMMTTRIEVIGRKVSDVAKDFFRERLEKLETFSSNGKVELETLAKGPATNNRINTEQPKKQQPSADDAIVAFGFFTWFYALAKSIDQAGYLHVLWMEMYIYDLCEAAHVDNMIKDRLFGTQMAVFRPSVSNINTPQGENINVSLAFSFKRQNQLDKVFHVPLSMFHIKQYGVHRLISKHVKFVYKANNAYRSIDDLKCLPTYPNLNPNVNDYHGTIVRMTLYPELDGIEQPHCANCRCLSASLESIPDSPHVGKKARSPSGNSDQISSSSDWQNNGDSLTHKQVCSPAGSQGSMEPSSTTIRDNSQFDQVNSPVNTMLHSNESCTEYNAVFPDSKPCMDMLTFSREFSDMEKGVQTNDELISRDQVISNCQNAFAALYANNFEGAGIEKILQLTNAMGCLSEQSPRLDEVQNQFLTLCNFQLVPMEENTTGTMVNHLHNDNNNKSDNPFLSNASLTEDTPVIDIDCDFAMIGPKQMPSRTNNLDNVNSSISDGDLENLDLTSPFDKHLHYTSRHSTNVSSPLLTGIHHFNTGSSSITYNPLIE